MSRYIFDAILLYLLIVAIIHIQFVLWVRETYTKTMIAAFTSYILVKIRELYALNLLKSIMPFLL